MKRAALAPQLVESLCRLNQAANQCRWLARDSHGFLCVKHDPSRRWLIEQSEQFGSLRALADHCNGIYPWIYHDPPAGVEMPLYDAGSIIFVFGSNLAGRHGRGAALHAVKFFGARYGEGSGRTGNAYAIPTKDRDLQVLPLDEIKVYVDRFLEYAQTYGQLTFLVSAIGCGLAGYTPDQMAPMFVGFPDNCYMPPRFVLDRP